MLLLSIDTSGPQGSVALARGDAQSFELIEQAIIAGKMYSAELVPQISALLAQNNLRKEQIDAFIAAAGPGSFTGLRVGLAAVKALAEILQKPVVPVSVLDAIVAAHAETNKNDAARRHDQRALLLPALAAGRGEFYVAEYDLRESAPQCRREWVATVPELAELVSGNPSKYVLITPESALIAELTKLSGGKNLPVQHAPRPDAADIAKIGLVRLLLGESVGVDALEAKYIRRSDAELFSLPKILSRK